MWHRGEDNKRNCETLMKNLPNHTTMITKNIMLNVNRSQQYDNETDL